VVGYDSIIPPGRAGKIKPGVKVKNMHGGEFHKRITVESNAANSPRLSLGIKGRILPIVGVSESYLRIKPDTQPKRVVLTSERKKLDVTKVTFKSRVNKGGPSWQTDAPIYLDIDVSHGDKPDSIGYYEHYVDLTLPESPEQTIHGEYLFVTTHPDRPEIKVRGAIEAH
jgi:hypothetical protein